MSNNNGWLAFSYSVPAAKPTLRVKVWRRLNAVGAVQLKTALYLLPHRESCLEHFHWLIGEIEAEGGEALLLECLKVGSLEDEEVRALFRGQRDGEYRSLQHEVAERRQRIAGSGGRDVQMAREARTFARKAAKRLSAIRAIDYFPSGRGEEVAAEIEALLEGVRAEGGGARGVAGALRVEEYAGRTWVTRERPYVDRLASFWLISRFIDLKALVRFVPHRPALRKAAGEVSFDIQGGDFSHRDGKVTFEVLIEDFGLAWPGLTRLAALVRDIDLAGESPEGLSDEAGLLKDVLDGLVRVSADDQRLLERALFLFDALYATYSK